MYKMMWNVSKYSYSSEILQYLYFTWIFLYCIILSTKCISEGIFYFLINIYLTDTCGYFHIGELLRHKAYIFYIFYGMTVTCKWVYCVVLLLLVNDLNTSSSTDNGNNDYCVSTQEWLCWARWVFLQSWVCWEMVSEGQLTSVFLFCAVVSPPTALNRK